jgi:Fe2+ transport system protein FeoA
MVRNVFIEEAIPMRLSECTVGKKATVIDLMVNETYKKRILDLGMLQGTEVQIVRKAPFGGPLVLQLRGYQISIRVEEAKQIEIEAVS